VNITGSRPSLLFRLWAQLGSHHLRGIRRRQGQMERFGDFQKGTKDSKKCTQIRAQHVAYGYCIRTSTERPMWASPLLVTIWQATVVTTWPTHSWFLPSQLTHGSYLASSIMVPTWPAHSWFLPGQPTSGSYLASPLLIPTWQTPPNSYLASPLLVPT
jgi:hypothetical protein